MDQDTELRSRLAAVRQRWTMLVRLHAAGRSMSGAAIGIAIAVGVLSATAANGGALLLLIATGLLATVAALWLPLRHMPESPSDRQVARFIEERAGALTPQRSLDDTVVTAVDALGPADPGRDPFRPLLVNDAIRRLRAIDAHDIVTTRSVRLACGYAAGSAVALAIAVAAGAPWMGRAGETARVRLFPGSVRLNVTPGNARIAAGSPLTIRAAIHGTSGALTRLTPSLTATTGEEHRTVPMVPAGDGFEYTLQSVDRPFSYSVAAGSARSAEYTVTALTPPRVHRIDLHYEYPRFAGLAPRDEENGGDIYAPAGTRVRLRIHTDKPIVRGQISVAGKSALPARVAGERMVEADLVLAANESYRVGLFDADGLQSTGETEYFIRLMDDRPPDVRIVRPSADQQITPLEETAIEARADDDYGIAAFDLVYAVAGRPERIVPFERVSGTDVQKIGTRLLPAEDLGVKPGDVISYYARARDVGRGKRPVEATSDIFFLEVKPFNEEFVAAQSQAGAGAGESEIGSLIDAQKAIISSTWNIERRAQAGRSATDVHAVAQAQAELKRRVELMNPRSVRGRPAAIPQRAAQAPRGPSSGADPMADAIESMSKALQQLTTERTREALPHEMAALNGLLQAQAAIRRTQVSQQNNGPGSGGGNRQGQDLSALFDKELQRQQRTNYETQSAIETRPDRGEATTSALDRIRDLAKRQEDLSGRQRELAQAGLAADEMKRQLETLTREQTELRRQAEDLAREMATRPERQNGTKPVPNPARTTGDLRAVAEEMRSAASGLGGDDPKGAAQTGQRAADHLRRLEQQMRGADGAEGQRVQLEAQQIAQEQRRIAAEAQRLEHTSGSAAATARQRLAGEKDRLAGRVDELQRVTSQLGQRAAPSSEAATMRAASGELDRERIAQRIRDSARQMREPARSATSTPPAGNGSTAEVEQAIARALERVANSLESSASAQTRQLSDQLGEVGAIRDRLQRLEQQIRDAEARAGGGRQSARPQEGASGSAGAVRPGTGSRSGSGASPGQSGPSAQSGRSSGTGRGGSSPGETGSELAGLRDEYRRELQRAQEALGRLTSGAANGGTPEQQEFSRSAPGTEAFKQDRSGWENLRKDIDRALETQEAAASQRLARTRAEDRVSAGGSDRVPEGYRRSIAKYFESLAKDKQ
jgi:hypothetical protein